MRVISTKWVKTRKPHHCWGCTQEFPAGSLLNRVVSIEEPTATSVYWCIICDNFIRVDKEARDINGDGTGFDYGELKDYENYPLRKD